MFSRLDVKEGVLEDALPLVERHHCRLQPYDKDCRWVRELLQQFGDFLLHAVGLRQSRDAGLAQNLVLGHGRRG